jgi:hypothetical protein
MMNLTRIFIFAFLIYNVCAVPVTKPDAQMLKEVRKSVAQQLLKDEQVNEAEALEGRKSEEQAQPLEAKEPKSEQQVAEEKEALMDKLLAEKDVKAEQQQSEEDQQEQEQQQQVADDKEQAERLDSSRKSREADKEQQQDEAEAQQGEDKDQQEQEQQQQQSEDQKDDADAQPLVAVQKTKVAVPTRRVRDLNRKEEQKEQARKQLSEQAEQAQQLLAEQEQQAQQRISEKVEQAEHLIDEKSSKAEQRVVDKEIRAEQRISDKGIEAEQRVSEKAERLVQEVDAQPILIAKQVTVAKPKKALHVVKVRNLEQNEQEQEAEAQQGEDKDQQQDEAEAQQGEDKDQQQEQQQQQGEDKDQQQQEQQQQQGEDKDQQQQEQQQQVADDKEQAERLDSSRKSREANKEQQQQEAEAQLAKDEQEQQQLLADDKEQAERLESRKSRETEPTEEHPTNPCETSDFKYYQPHPTDATKYYQCDPWGSFVLRTCANDTIWNRWTLKCEEPENVKNLTSLIPVGIRRAALFNCTATGSVCVNGGVCVNEVGVYRCDCVGNFTGELCEMKINESDMFGEIMQGNFSLREYVNKLVKESSNMDASYYERYKKVLDEATYTKLMNYLTKHKEGYVRYDILINSLVEDVLGDIYPDADFLRSFNISSQNIVATVRLVPNLLSYAKYSSERYQEVFVQYQNVLGQLWNYLNATCPNMSIKARVYSDLTRVFLNDTNLRHFEENTTNEDHEHHFSGRKFFHEELKTENVVKQTIKTDYDVTLEKTYKLYRLLVSFEKAVSDEYTKNPDFIQRSVSETTLPGATEIIGLFDEIQNVNIEIWDSLVSYGFWYLTNMFTVPSAVAAVATSQDHN